jgi:alpha-glucosidase
MAKRVAGLVRACAFLGALLVASPALAGWASLGAFPAPARESNALVFENEQGVASVSVLAPEIVRVRFSPTPAFGRDHSYAVVTRDFGDPGASFDSGGDRSVITTRALKVTIRHSPFRLSFASAAGDSLDEDDPDLGTAVAGTRVKVWKRLREDEHVYGVGEKMGRLDKRGQGLGGYAYTMWNSDTPGYDSGTDPIYVSVPFLMVLRNGRAHGIFLDNTFRSSIDVGHETQELLALGVPGGELDYYFIDGPSPKQVIERYTALTGRTPLPPRWALGYHQCRYSYYPESKVRYIAQSFRERAIPADTIWLDIHYLDNYKPFTWDRERFPDPKKLISDLRAQGFRVVTILDPHPKKEPGYLPYDSGKAGDHFVKNPDGSDYVGPVWPANAPVNPGPSVFPDFSKPAAREWWGGLYKLLTDVGVAGIWNDMNEPAVFTPYIHTMPTSVRHDNDGQPTDHREIHNVYGQLMTRSTFEGLSRLRPDERPFVLTRATYAGGQRYAAVWPGDNVSNWPHLAQSLPTLMNLGLSGFPFVGSDIGGFEQAPSPELYTRWLQAGVFYPFMRTHTSIGTPDQEPWSYGVRHEAINRRAIELRYELLPQIYQAMREASETGIPALRPLFLEFPEDAETYQIDDQFLLGRDLLVAPVVRDVVTERELYLPAGDWYDYWTGRLVAGGRKLRVPVTLETIPIYVRAGAFLFRQPVVQHTGQMSGQPLSVTVYPATQSQAAYYEDDGETLAYRRGAFASRRFAQRREAGRTSVEASAVEGTWRPAPRDLVVRVRADGETRRVLLDRAPGARLAATSGGTETGWRPTDDGFVEVRLRDPAEAFAITLEGPPAALPAKRSP